MVSRERIKSSQYASVLKISIPIDTVCKLNGHKMFRRRPGRFLNVLCAFNLRSVSRRILLSKERFLQFHKRRFFTILLAFIYIYIYIYILYIYIYILYISITIIIILVIIINDLQTYTQDINIKYKIRKINPV